MRQCLIARIPKNIYKTCQGDENFVCILREYLDGILSPFDSNQNVEEHEEECLDCESNNEICTTCWGRGYTIYRKNPFAKFDTCTIGGLWAGKFYNIVSPENFTELELQYNVNTIQFDKIINREDLIPSAILIDNIWYDCGHYNKTEWKNKVKRLYNKYKEDYAILLDYHF